MVAILHSPFEHNHLVDDPLPLAQEPCPGLDLGCRGRERTSGGEVRCGPVEATECCTIEPAQGLLLYPVGHRSSN